MRGEKRPLPFCSAQSAFVRDGSPLLVRLCLSTVVPTQLPAREGEDPHPKISTVLAFEVFFKY